ncbi:MAG: SDR family oxidoreductase [Endozoicomonas sp. (ex Botrylloides leachii)]|nr:SDR family oxidoreductase [Endozoicomonas sp. (ex Botrylloides leachii)]
MILNINEKNVLITGGAQGIGRLFAKKAIEEGANVILWDINSTSLEQTARELRKKQGANVFTYTVNVSSVSAINEAAKQVFNDVGTIDILFNNAGIVVGKPFIEHTEADIDKTLAINTAGPMHVTNAFMHGMIRNGGARIVNIASAAGLVANPKMSVYAASKWAVIGWSESLRLELERAGHDIKVTTVTPSYINTGMFQGVKTPFFVPLIQPQKIVDLTWEGMKKGKIYVRAPKMVNLLPFLRGILPTRVFDFIGGKLIGIYNSMDEFKGHTAPTPTQDQDQDPAMHQ